jgi:hypothetical protein
MWPLLFDISSTLAVENRTEVRARYVEPDSVIDIETDPKLSYRGSVRNGRDALSLSYSPRIVFTNLAGAERLQEPALVSALQAATPDTAPPGRVDVEDGDVRKLDLLHQGNLLLEWQWSNRTRFVTNTFAQYGRASVGTLLVQPRWNGEDRPQVSRPFSPIANARFDLLSISSEAAIAHFLSPRTMLVPSAYYFTYGGPTFEAQKRLPYLQNPGVRLNLTHSMTPTDELLVDVSPQVNIFSSTVQDLNAQLQPLRDDGQPVANPGDVPKFSSRDLPPIYQGFGEARWRHRFSQLVSLEASGGLNMTLQDRGTNERDPYNFSNAPTELRTRVFPVAELLANIGFRTLAARGKLVAYARLTPWFNLLVGENQTRVENVAAASFAFGLHTLRFQANYLQTVPGEDLMFRLITGEVGYDYRFSKAWAIDLGVRFGQQTAALPDYTKAEPFKTPRELSTVQPGGFVGLTFQPQNLKF